MTPLVEAFNFYLSLGTVLALAATLILLIDLAVFSGMYVVSFVRPYALRLAFLASVCGVVLTLVYSEIFDFVPCGLCWFERIFLYPQAVILALAFWRKEGRAVAEYGLALSLLGGAIALYHHYIQMGGSEFVKCPVSGVSCAKRIVFEFGFVTFPFMALVTFAGLSLLYIIVLRTSRKS